MRIDAHHHAWVPALSAARDAGIRVVLECDDTMERLRPMAAAAGINATVAVQTVGLHDETEQLLALADRDPLIAGVVGWVDLGADDVEARLDNLLTGAAGSRLVGIRTMLPCRNEHGAWPAVDGIRAAAERGLAIDLLLTSRQLIDALSIVEALPEARFVIDHLAKPDVAGDDFDDWRRGMAAVARQDNVAVKLSGLLTQLPPAGRGVDALAPYVAAAIDEFGTHRVMVGSDWPLCERVAPAIGGYARSIAAMESLAGEASNDEVVNGAASMNDRHRVMAGTAIQWYRLEMSETGMTR